jgi:hypothetical protein
MSEFHGGARSPIFGRHRLKTGILSLEAILSLVQCTVPKGDNMPNYRFVALAALILAPVAAQAQDAAAPAAATTPAAIRPGTFLKTSDGKRAGQIFSVDKGADGSVAGAALIGSNSTLVHVPISTITAVDKTHFTTTMSYKDIFH